MNSLDLAYAVGAVLLSPAWARKARGGWAERFGKLAPLPAAAPGRPRILLHAVSVGEVNALRGLVPLLRAHAEVVVAAATDTGLIRARELFGDQAPGGGGERGPVVRYPLDFSQAVGRFLDAVRPDAVGLVELEVWPNFIAACRRRGIPVGVINGRLSERSFKGYRRIRRWIGRSFASLAFAAVQDEAYAERFLAMGAPVERVTITGSMKWDAASLTDDVPAAAQLARDLGVDRARPLIVAGSTAGDEEALLHAACPPGAQLLCAPRKPERFDDAAQALPGCVRRSRAGALAGSGGGAAGRPADRFLLDTIGELRAAYALADVVVMGRSFGRLYGSDPIEPAALGKPVLIGPAYKDFDSIVRTLAEARALEIVSRESLAARLAALLADPPRRAEMAQRARACILANQGATARHARLLMNMAQATAKSR